MKSTIIRTGTETVEPRKRLIRAGNLEAMFDAGALRWIRWDGVEILRAITFLVRTPGWGTPAPDIGNLLIEESNSYFRIRYDATYGEPGKAVIVRISILGGADGVLQAEAQISAQAPFETNRTGFVILHALAGFAGTEVDVQHASGQKRRVTIPLPISPSQPVMDIRAITHSPSIGLDVATGFEGDIFEMEDQRNWSDASFKTYSRPIGLPYPYLLTPEAPTTQSVTVTVTDRRTSRAASPRPVTVPAVSGQRVPAFALPLDSLSDAGEALRFAAPLSALAPARILLRYDPARGDTLAGTEDLAALLRHTKAELEILVLLAGDDAGRAEAELAKLARAFDTAGTAVSHVGAFAKVDEQSFQPGEPRPPNLAEADISALVAKLFPKSRRGGGSPAFFTEFNRKRPDPALADYLTFSTTPMVHAADDASVMETLQALPHILYSATALAGGRPLSIGPVGIGARINPYGAAPSENEPGERQGMAARDPRQRGLLAAAWHVGYLAQLAPWNVERFAFAAPTGAFGLISTPQTFSRAGWDEWPEGAVHPLYHVARWISGAAGARLVCAGVDGSLAHVCFQRDGVGETLYANIGEAPIAIDLSRHTAPSGQLLDEASFEEASLSPDRFAMPKALPSVVQLAGYAVLHINGGSNDQAS